MDYKNSRSSRQGVFLENPPWSRWIFVRKRDFDQGTPPKPERIKPTNLQGEGLGGTEDAASCWLSNVAAAARG